MTRTQKEIKAVRDAGFSGYDKSLHSKCRQPEKYGIQRVSEAEQALQAAITQIAIKMPRIENRSKPNRVQARFDKCSYALLQQAFAASTHKTLQDFIENACMKYANDILKENAATGAGTPISGTDKKSTNSISDIGGEVKCMR